MEMTFPGGKKVAASWRGFTVISDQPASGGGEDSAPTPFELFLISIGSCAGFFALSFCQARKIPEEGLRVTAAIERDPATHMVPRIGITVRLPAGFPDKYRDAIVQAVKACMVTKHLDRPPRIEVEAVPS
ncbi:MAG: OsmC family protein [Planctomycetes bacterium]|nr:OsmC family protein [Planctomycetota bacterium]